MNVTIQPSEIKGIIAAPPSKSSMQRALAAALLHKGDTILTNPGSSDDDKAMLKVIESLGARVIKEAGQLHIKSQGIRPELNKVNFGESGLGIRMMAPIIALSESEMILEGEGSLRSRPMDFFDKVFPQLNVSISSNEGLLPLTLAGPLQPANITVDGSLSSQFITGLLFAYSAADATDVTIKVTNATSRPYIDLTLDVMKKFGMKLPSHTDDYDAFYFSSGNSDPEEIHYQVEGDWSGGAFLLVAGAIAGPVRVTGLDITSKQADRQILDAMMAANASIAIDAKGIQVRPGEMDAFYFDATNCPDLFPPLVALAAYCKGKTTIKGANRLIHKESNRAVSLQDEFDAMGLTITIKGDLLYINGGVNLKGADVFSHHDHRIAMALAVAALRADSETVIADAEAVNKSYPDFFHDLKSLGASVSLPFTTINHSD